MALFRVLSWNHKSKDGARRDEEEEHMASQGLRIEDRGCHLRGKEIPRKVSAVTI